MARRVDQLLDVSHLPSDEQLAADAAREGSDGPAFKALVERHRERVWRICFRLLGNEHDAHDAAQEVFVRLFLQRARFSGKSKYTTWVHAIAVRTCLTIRRARGRRHRHEAAAGVAQSEHVRGEADASVGLDLARMLETLDEEDRALMILKYAEDYSYEELAEIFELSASACKMRVSRAKERLQKQFGEQAPLEKSAS
jgi:RNA polymerase sigma-70 factor (ECF subfamily)